MDAEVDRSAAAQSHAVRRHVRQVLLNLVLHRRQDPDLARRLAGLRRIAQCFRTSAFFEPDGTTLLEALPMSVYATDAEGFIVFYNEAAVSLWGRRPALGRDRWSGAWRLFRPDGSPLPHGQSPMAVALRENREIRNVEVVMERPDGTRVRVLPFTTPLRNAADALVGAVSVLVDLRALAVPGRPGGKAQERAEPRGLRRSPP